MKKAVQMLLGSIFLTHVLAGGTRSAAESKPTVPVEFIAAEAVLELQRAARPMLTVDVRSRQEFEVAHIKGAVNLPLGELPQRYREIPRQGTVVLY